MANIQCRYILLNYQDSSEFICQVLNRDLWSDDTLKAYIKENFLFMQISSESTIGKRYLSYYPVDELPHIAIIDPKTGKIVLLYLMLIKRDLLNLFYRRKNEGF